MMGESIGRKGRTEWTDESSSGSFDCVTHGETVSHFAQDDGVKQATAGPSTTHVAKCATCFAQDDTGLEGLAPTHRKQRDEWGTRQLTTNNEQLRSGGGEGEAGGFFLAVVGGVG